jgi:hypothetical protein
MGTAKRQPAIIWLWSLPLYSLWTIATTKDSHLTSRAATGAGWYDIRGECGNAQTELGHTGRFKTNRDGEKIG